MLTEVNQNIPEFQKIYRIFYIKNNKLSVPLPNLNGNPSEELSLAK